MATIIDLTCEFCGKDFQVKKGREKKFCSKECKLAKRHQDDEKSYEEKKCPNCKKNFKTKKKFNQTCCSIKCSSEYQSKLKNLREIRKCKVCGKNFEVRKKVEKEICSDECRKVWAKNPKVKEKRLEKIKETNLKKYGVENIFQSKQVQEKLKQTNLKKYGVEKPFFSNEKALKTLKNKRNKKLYERFYEKGYEIIKFTDDKLTIKHPDGHVFTSNRKLLVNRLNHNVEISIKILPISSPKSSLEIKIGDFLKENNIKYVTNDRNLLNKNEIDILIESHKICIEINGIYWHSEYYIDKEYHINKLIECNNKGYTLLQFFEDEIIENFDIIKSILKSKLGLISNKFFGRKSIIKHVNSKDCKKFLNENHIQLNVNSSIKIGLYYDEKLVSIMTFSKKRKILGKNNKENKYELLRFCNLLDTVVVGGASKLLNYFIKEYSPSEIISYANLRFSNGNLYDKLGFTLLGNTPPNYFYVVNKERKHRFNYRKDVLIKEGYDPNKTEHEIMLERKIPRIYDCGNKKYIKRL
ncbi:MAG: DUF7487 domain-containing protein [bacterium]